MTRPSDSLGLAKTVVRATYEYDLKSPAAALAYYGFVSFVPLLLLVFAVVGRRIAGQIYASTPDFSPPTPGCSSTRR